MLTASLLLALPLAVADAPTTPPPDAAVSDAGRGVLGSRGEASY